MTSSNSHEPQRQQQSPLSQQQSRREGNNDDALPAIIDPNLYGLTGYHPDHHHHHQHQHHQANTQHTSNTHSSSNPTGISSPFNLTMPAQNGWREVDVADPTHTGRPSLGGDPNLYPAGDSPNRLTSGHDSQDLGERSGQHADSPETPLIAGQFRAGGGAAGQQGGNNPHAHFDASHNGGSHASPQNHGHGHGHGHGPASGSPNAMRHSRLSEHLHHHHGHKHTSIFDLAHARGKSVNHDKQNDMSAYDEQEPIRLSHLFKRPVIRQWLYGGNYYREKDERQASRFELFFDLLFVGVVHQLADGLAETAEATTINVGKFILVFYPAYSIWNDVRHYINQSGTDDIWQRIYILVIMILLVGYTANACGIEIVRSADGIIEGVDEEATANETDPAGQAAIEAGNGARRALAGIAAAAMSRRNESGEEEGLPTLVRPIRGTDFWFTEGYHYALNSAIGFFLVAKALKLCLLFAYGLLLPKFRRALWLEMIPVALLACIYIPLCFVYDPGWIAALIAAGIAMELASKYVINILTQQLHGRFKRQGKEVFIPAQSVEHLAERTVMFVVLVIGEAILNSTYSATTERYGISREYARSALAVVSSFFLVWIYFDADSSRVYLHALRRNPFSAITFNHLHYPLCASLILLSSALPRLIKEVQSEPGFRWFYGGAMCCALACMACIGMLHKNLDLVGSSLWPHWARILLRLAVAVAFGLLPMRETLPNTEFLATYAGLLCVLVVSETVGKIGVRGRVFNEEKADEYYRQLKEHSRTARKRAAAGGADSPQAPMPMEKLGMAQSPQTMDDKYHPGILENGHGHHQQQEQYQQYQQQQSPPSGGGPDASADISMSMSKSGSGDMSASQDTALLHKVMGGQHGGPQTVPPIQSPSQQPHQQDSTMTHRRPGQQRSMSRDLSSSAADLLHSTRAALNPYTSGVRLSRRSSWHPYDDLMPDEQGNEDVGIEGELGQMQVKERMDPGQRWALVAN